MIETATYLDGLPPVGDLRQAKVNALGELQSQRQEELEALFPFAEGSPNYLFQPCHVYLSDRKHLLFSGA